MPETSGACTAGLLFIVDSLVGAPFSTLFFVAAIGAQLRRLASSAASCFLTHRKCGLSERLFYQLYAASVQRLKRVPCRRQSRGRRPELCWRADQNTSCRTGSCATTPTQCAHGCRTFLPFAGTVDVRGSHVRPW